MIHNDDYASLQRILGVQELPETLVKEYEIRLRMFHKDNHSGALGTLALIDLIRGLGVVSEETSDDKPTKTDWGKYADKTPPTRIESRFFGDWLPGNFLTIGNSGVLHVKLDGDEMVRECRPDMVRLSDILSPPKEELSAAQKLATAALDAVREQKPIETVEPVEDPFDWTTVKAGEDVVVTIDGEEKDAKFFAIGIRPDTIRVIMSGKEYVVPIEDAEYFGNYKGN